MKGFEKEQILSSNYQSEDMENPIKMGILEVYGGKQQLSVIICMQNISFECDKAIKKKPH